MTRCHNTAVKSDVLPAGKVEGVGWDATIVKTSYVKGPLPWGANRVNSSAVSLCDHTRCRIRMMVFLVQHGCVVWFQLTLGAPVFLFNQ